MGLFDLLVTDEIQIVNFKFKFESSEEVHSFVGSMDAGFRESWNMAHRSINGRLMLRGVCSDFYLLSIHDLEWFTTTPLLEGIVDRVG